MLQTDQQFPGIDNLGKGMEQNGNGSYNIYIKVFFCITILKNICMKDRFYDLYETS